MDRGRSVSSGQRRLLVFLKYPTPGRVKTRLAAALGDEAACAIYRACVELTLERLSSWRGEVTLCVDPPEAVDAARAWLGDGWSLRPQRGATLGERLTEATDVAFSDGAQRVVVIGTDSPWLRASDLTGAFQALEHADAVVGPSADGGYYLIGLAQRTPRLFEDVAWGSSSVFETTCATARQLGLRMPTLPLGYDIDTREDVERFLREERWAEEHRASSVAALIETIAALSQRRTVCQS